MQVKLAGCVIADDTGKILLLHRNTDRSSQWEIPGGKVEAGETAKQAAIREVKEELGVEVNITRKFGSKVFVDRGVTIHYTWFQANISSGKPVITEPQFFDGLAYFSLKELDGITQSSGLQNFLNVRAAV